MSTYVDIAINPKTGMEQKALFIDDYYGAHKYGVAFRNNGTDATLSDKIKPDDCIVYPIENIELKLDSSRRSDKSPIKMNNFQS